MYHVQWVTLPQYRGKVMVKLYMSYKIGTANWTGISVYRCDTRESVRYHGIAPRVEGSCSRDGRGRLGVVSVMPQLSPDRRYNPCLSLRSSASALPIGAHWRLMIYRYTIPTLWHGAHLFGVVRYPTHSHDYQSWMRSRQVFPGRYNFITLFPCHIIKITVNFKSFYYESPK